MSNSPAEERYEPNLTPILDMVFQLITFFMLVMNFKAASMDLSLKLPVVGSAQPADARGQGSVLVLNLNAEGQLVVYGEKQDADKYIANEASAAFYVAKVDKPDMKFGDELPVTIVLRADKDIPFHLLNHLVQLCQKNGFRKFQYRAMNATAET